MDAKPFATLDVGYLFRQLNRTVKPKHEPVLDINLTIIKGENGCAQLTLDEAVDINNFPFDVSVFIFGFLENPTEAAAVQILKRADAILEETPLHITDYSIVLIPERNKVKENEAQNWWEALSAHNIPKDKSTT